jgi:hypothetical protein
MHESLKFGLWDRATFKPSAPKPPDPYKVADAQSQSNIKTAQEQARLAMTGQVTPMGSLSYVADPTSPSGYRAVTELSPEQQALFGQGQDLQAQYGAITGEQLGRVGDRLADPFDMAAGRATEITDIQRTFLDPQWASREQALQTELMNRGIRPGSEQYETAMRQFGQQRGDAYNQMFLSAYDTANRSALTERGLPLQELASLRGGMAASPGMPETVKTPTPGVAPTDITGPTYQSYNAQLQQHNAMMGGLFNMGSAALGGWASSPAGSAALAGLISDRRLKTDIERIGDDPRGWGVYRFKYIWDGVKKMGWQIGYMAQEVLKVRPDAVLVHEPSGALMVDYDKLAMA